MAPRKRRNPPSPPSAEAMAVETSSDASNPRNLAQPKTPASSVSSSSSFSKGRRGRPKKLGIAIRSNGDLKNSAGAIVELQSGASDSTSTTTKKLRNPEIPNSKSAKPDIPVAGKVSLKETADPEQSFFPAASNEGAAGDRSYQPPRPSLIRKKSLRKGKPNRAPFY